MPQRFSDSQVLLRVLVMLPLMQSHQEKRIGELVRGGLGSDNARLTHRLAITILSLLGVILLKLFHRGVEIF